MRTETAIDTVTMQVNFYNESIYDTTIEAIIQRLEKYKYFVNNKENIEVEYKHKLISTINKGSFSYEKQDKSKANKIWYLSIKLAGLKKYIPWRDKASHNALMLIISYLNTNKHIFKITQFDVALNIFTKYENILALCMKRFPTTEYWGANQKQIYKTTTWMEKFKNSKHKANAVFHGCHYDKSIKEKLDYSLTRFEVSFQKPYFKNKGFNIGTIYNDFNRYYMLYVPNKKKRQEIKDMYDSKENIRKKDIKDMRLERYRLHIDIKVLIDFSINLYGVNDDTIDHFML